MDWSKVLPMQVRGRAASMGEAGERWLMELNGVISLLEQQWCIKVQQVLEGGSGAFSALALTENGEEWVLKIAVPMEEAEFLQSIAHLRLAKGKGYPVLYGFSAEHRAVLMERLGVPMRLSSLSPKEQMEKLTAALKETWSLPKKGSGLSTATSYRWFREYLAEGYQALNAPCRQSVIDRAFRELDLLEQRTRPEEYVVIHGDAHNNNFLEVPGTGEYKLIDPDGAIFEKSYDLGVLMREWPEEYENSPAEEGRARSAFLSRLTGVEEKDIFAWGYLQMVATGMILLQIGDETLGRKMLSIAETWEEKEF